MVICAKHAVVPTDSLSASSWQKNIVLAPSSTSDFATLCESPVSSSAQQSIDLHTLDEVSLVRTIQGYHRHHRWLVKDPWEKNFFLAPNPSSLFWLKIIPSFGMNRCSVCFRILTQWKMRMTKWNFYFVLLDLFFPLMSVCFSKSNVLFLFRNRVCIEGLLELWWWFPWGKINSLPPLK